MSKKIMPGDIHIRTQLQAGDIGYIIHRHGVLYKQEYDYGIKFEIYVAAGLHEFYHQYNPAKDRVWICEHDKKIIGYLLLMHRPGNTAQLRYFFLEPAFRGLGLGKRMMNLYMDFYRSCGYDTCYLWTTHEQEAAAALYTKNGFRLTSEKKSVAFGKPLKEQRYELH